LISDGQIDFAFTLGTNGNNDKGRQTDQEHRRLLTARIAIAHIPISIGHSRSGSGTWKASWLALTAVPKSNWPNPPASKKRVMPKVPRLHTKSPEVAPDIALLPTKPATPEVPPRLRNAFPLDEKPVMGLGTPLCVSTYPTQSHADSQKTSFFGGESAATNGFEKVSLLISMIS
jgi:hypothetical protein